MKSSEKKLTYRVRLVSTAIGIGVMVVLAGSSFSDVLESKKKVEAAGISFDQEGLVKALDDPKTVLYRREIVEVLISLYPMSGRDLLTKRSQGAPDSMEEIYLAEALIKSDERAAREILFRIMEQARVVDPRVRLAVASRLAKLGDYAGFRWVLEFSGSPDPQVAAAVAGSLSYFWEVERVSEREAIQRILGQLLLRKEKVVQISILSTFSSLARQYPSDPVLLGLLGKFVQEAQDEWIKKQVKELLQVLPSLQCAKIREEGGQCPKK